MLDWIDQIDKQLFVHLNGSHTAFWDTVMLWITQKNSWLPFYALLIAFFAYTKRLGAVWVLVAVALAIAGADQITSGFMKPFFERLRPCHAPDLAGMVHNVGKCGGQYGFASSHAANTFALATLLWLVFRKDYPQFVLMFGWAAVVSYSRIYVGVHYPADILVGGAIGAGCGWLAFVLYRTALARIQTRKQG
jgi:undecaprenyl-diphosphatase